MKIKLYTIIIILFSFIILFAFKSKETNSYKSLYNQNIENFNLAQEKLLTEIKAGNLNDKKDIVKIRQALNEARTKMKFLDFWLRYLEPNTYKKINGPLPVEWETEVFEKYEKPYRRVGCGLTLAELYLEEDVIEKDTLIQFIANSINATKNYTNDTITKELYNYHHFYLCNRLFLLNLAAIYTTGFECPDTSKIIPELEAMMKSNKQIYFYFNQTFESQALPNSYISLYDSALAFVKSQSKNYSTFNHFTFIQQYINPLYAINRQLILKHHVISKNLIDYSLNKNAETIFDKTLYNGQNAKGLYIRVNDSVQLSEIVTLGKLLFYDPILSANNKRSCASCHFPSQYFTDTSNSTAFQFDNSNRLSRNTPSLINVQYNHLIMLDGEHISLQNQTHSVITNPIEMASNQEEVLKKVLDCKDYKVMLKKLLTFTPQESEITLTHITSAITLYYSKFSNYYSPFDQAINQKTVLSHDELKGFNLFMSKAQCATCHFVPHFNGVKPPYIGSEFEVLGTPKDKAYKNLSEDKGRYNINPAYETENAFRTGSLRNIAFTQPYMHNGVFSNLTEVLDFYNTGGGAGHGLNVPNQTLSSDSLGLKPIEIKQIIAFLNTLTEEIPFESAPKKLPINKNKQFNIRKVGGEY